MSGISDMFDTINFIVMALTLIAFLSWKKRWFQLKFTLITIIGGVILTFLLKAVIGRPRPENGVIDTVTTSYPSAHAAITTLFILLLLYLFWAEMRNKYLKTGFSILGLSLIFLVGFSRVYLNVHWLFDVIGGFLLGLFWITFMILFFEFYDALKIVKKV
jgi:undecaprenyl-diphosphatase